MSRPYPDTFDSSRSPLASRPAAASTPVSYQANVNRQKTKKWVDAKPGNYGGDDWGDEYDDGYDDPPPPPPVPKVTGLRQPGQGARADIGNKKTYGELPNLPTDAQDRSTTNPPLLRRSSFTKDDERRAFLSGPSQQGSLADNTGALSANAAVPSPPLPLSTHASQRKQVPSPVTETSAPHTDARTSYAESNRSSAHTASDTRSASGDMYNNYPIPDVTSPLRSAALSSQARVSSPLGRTESPPVNASSPGTQFAPRTASLTQTTIPDQSDTNSAGPAATAPAAKSLPFIRPADIYKRLEEERQRGKESLDSSRPSMDSMAAVNPDRQSSPGLAQAAPPTVSVPQQPSTQGSGGYDTYQEDTPDYGRRLAPMLEPVLERKSEYGFDDMAVKSPEAAYKLQQETQKPEPPLQQYQPYKPESYSAQEQTNNSTPTQQNQPTAATDAEANRRYSMSPKLPDLHRMSGFGFDWSDSTADGVNVVQSPVSDPQQTKEAEQPLRKQESQGFTSVVHQAFDGTSSIPETPSSLNTSDVRRNDSDSTGTTGISPIMSRVSSGANPNFHGRGQEPRDNLTPAIAEENEPDSRRSSNIVVQQQPTPLPAYEDEEPNQTPFHLGHRRDMSTPSPGNSPARTPNLETASLAQSGEMARVMEEARPTMPTEGNQSFRPELPGGWNSYSAAAGQTIPAASGNAQSKDIDSITAKAPESPEKIESPQLPMDEDRSPASSGESSVPPLAPIKHDGVNEIAPKDDLETQNRLSKIPTLSTNASPTDDETDRLRKEIVKSLSPREPEVNAAQQSWVSPSAPAEQSNLSLPAPSNAPRDSMYLPSEYDNYWAETDEAEAQPAFQEQKQTGSVPDATDSSNVLATGLHRVDESKDIPPIAPLSPKRISMSPAEPRPAALERRFSWEIEPEEVTTLKTSPSPPPISQPISSEGAGQGSLQDAIATRPDSASPAPLSIPSARVSRAQSEEPPRDSVISEGVRSQDVVTASIRPISGDSHDVHDTTSQVAPLYNKSLSADGTDTVSPMSTKAEPIISPSQQINSMLDIVPPQPTPPPQGEPRQSPTGSQTNEGPRLQVQVDPKIPRGFREIMALSSAEQRINAYNESRAQFATMDSGLGEWMYLTTAQQHAQMQGGFGDAGANARTAQRPKSGNALAPQPQPYYQQYLNASTPTTTTPPPARYSGGTPTGSQGFGSGSGKTTQQMQAKSKELLHSAGVFGGRASKAGKGLLAKGKSRFMGSGDKDGSKANNSASPIASSVQDKPTPVQDKPTKTSRRASWGFALTTSHSSGRPATFGGAESAPFGHARASSSSDTPQPRRGSASSEQTPKMKTLSPGDQPNANATSDANVDNTTPTAPAPNFLELNLPHSSLKDARWGSTSTSVDGSAQSGTRESSVAGDAEGNRDNLAPPAPIGKYQPSWDPHNATPIVEEEGFGWDSPPRGLPQDSNAAAALSVAANAVSHPQIAVDTQDKGKGPEDTSSSGEWVMVSPENVHRIMTDPASVDAQQVRPAHVRADSEVSAITIKGLAADKSLPQSENEAADQGRLVGLPEAQEQSVEPVSEVVVADVATNGNALKHPDSDVSGINDAEVSPEVIYQSPVDMSLTNDKRQVGLWTAASTTATPGEADAPPPGAMQTPITDNNVPPSSYQPESQPSQSRTFTALPPIRRSSTFDYNSVARRAKERFSTQEVDQDDLRGSGAVSPVSQLDTQHALCETAEEPETVPAVVARQRESAETVRAKESNRYSFEESDGPQREVLSRPQTMIDMGSVEDRGGVVAPKAADKPYVAPIDTNQQPQGQWVPMQQGQKAVAEGGQMPPMSQGQMAPVQHGQVSPVQQRHLSPVPQGQMPPVQQGQYPQPHQGQYPQSHQGQYRPVQQWQYPPAQQGQMTPGQQGQYPPAPQGQFVSVQQGHMPPMQLGQIPPVQSGQFALIQQGQSRPVPHEQLFAASQGQMLPVHQGQISPQQQGQIPRLPNEHIPPQLQAQPPRLPQERMPPVQQGPRHSMPPSAHQRHSSSDAQPRIRSASNSSQGPGVPSSAGGLHQQPKSAHDATSQHQRPSIEGVRPRPPSFSGVSQPPKITPQYTENRSPSFARAGPPGIPPSSSQRYPELFQSQPGQGHPNDADRDVPPEYPAAERGHLPRQQATEYQLAGVGPPADDPRNGSVRHSRRSLILKEIGGRLSRGSSLERSVSHIEDDGTREMRSQTDSKRDSMASSDDISLDDPEKRPTERRRSWLVTALSPTGRGSTPDIPPQSRESMVTHRPSEVNLLGSPPPTLPGSPLAPPDKKRGFFSRSDTGGQEKKEDRPKMFSRQSTQVSMDSGGKQSEKAGREKKNRFSALSSMFTGKKGDSERGRGASRHGTWVPSMLPGIMLLVKNEQEKQILEQEGLVRRQLPPEQWGQLSGGLQQQQQQQFSGMPSGPNTRPGSVSNNPATRQRLNLNEAPRQQASMQMGMKGQNLQDRPMQSQMTPNMQPPKQSQDIAPLRNRQDSNFTVEESLQRSRADSTSASHQQMIAPVGMQGQTRGTPPQIAPNSQLQLQQGQLADTKGTPPVLGSRRNSEQPIGMQQRNSNGTPTQSRESTPRPIGSTDYRASHKPIDSTISDSDPDGRLRRHMTQPVDSPSRLQPEEKSLIVNPLLAMQAHGQEPATMLQQQQQKVTPSPLQPAYRPEDVRQPPIQQQQTYTPPPIQPQQTYSTVPIQQQQQIYAAPHIRQQQIYMNPQGQQQQMYANPSIQQQGSYTTPPMPPQASLQQQRPPEQTPVIAQKRSSQALRNSATPAEPAKPKKGLFSALLGGRRSSGMVDKSSSSQQGAARKEAPAPLNLAAAPIAGQQQQQQQQYATPPIPGAYALVRGEGTLAPTGYDPRGLNQTHSHTPVNTFQRAPLPPHMVEEYPGRPPQPPMNYASKWAEQDAALQRALQNKKDEEWNALPSVPFLSPEKAAERRLSSEDLLARSPARSQFGQQAPYQLRLPGEDENARERGRLAAEALRRAEDANREKEAQEKGAMEGETLVSVPKSTDSRKNSPLPKTVDSRNHSVSPPVVAQKPLERSDTITSAVSKMSSSGRGSPAVGTPAATAAAAAAGPSTITATTAAGSSAATPITVAEKRVSRVMPDWEEKIYDNSREGMIVVEDATVRRVNGGQAGGMLKEEDEDEEEGGRVKMSATSFPGDEWRPWVEEGEGL